MTELLQEYLVKIKYQTDETSKNTMLSGLKSTAGIVKGIAETVIATTAAVAGITYKLSKSVNSMYLESRNLGNSTVSSFRSIASAAEDVGSSVEQMTSALGGLEKFRRMTGAGANQFLSSFAGTDLTGKSSTDVMLSILKNIPQLKKQGMREETFLNAMEVSGMGYDVGYQAWERPEEMMKQYNKHKEANGSGIEKIAPGIHDQMTQFSVDIDKAMNVGASHFGELLQQINAKELEYFNLAITKVNEGASIIENTFKELSKNFKEYSEKIHTGFEVLIKEYQKNTLGLDKIADKLDILENLGSVLGSLGALVGLYKMKDFPKEQSEIAKKNLKTAYSRSGGDVEKEKAILEENAKRIRNLGILELFGKIIGTAFVVEAGYKFGKIIGEAFTDEIDKYFISPIAKALGLEDEGDSLYAKTQKKLSSGNSTFGISTRAKTGLESLKEMGMSTNDASAVMASLSRESANLDPFAEGDDGKAYGIEQWHAPRQALYKNLFGHSMKSVTDQNQAFAEQLSFINWERQNTEKSNWESMQQAQNDPYHRGYAYSKYIVRPHDEAGEGDARGMAALGFAQQAGDIHITVNGVNDPQKAAEIVMQKLKDKQSSNSRYNQMAGQ